MTHYEEIMSMGKDEFAEWLFNYSMNPCNMCEVSKGNTSEVAHTNCIEKMKEWLNSEVNK